eukprot:10614064-Ditylum_brightwellii.AAC.1
MKNERNNSKQQGPASNTTPKTGAITNKSKETQQSAKGVNPWEKMPFLCREIHVGKQQVFWQLSPTPKTAAIAFCHTPESEGKRQKKVRQKYQQ